MCDCGVCQKRWRALLSLTSQRFPAPETKENTATAQKKKQAIMANIKKDGALHCYRHNRISGFWDSTTPILGSPIIIMHHTM